MELSWDFIVISTNHFFFFLNLFFTESLHESDIFKGVLDTNESNFPVISCTSWAQNNQSKEENAMTFCAEYQQSGITIPMLSLGYGYYYIAKGILFEREFGIRKVWDGKSGYSDH